MRQRLDILAVVLLAYAVFVGLRTEPWIGLLVGAAVVVGQVRARVLLKRGR